MGTKFDRLIEPQEDSASFPMPDLSWLGLAHKREHVRGLFGGRGFLGSRSTRRVLVLPSEPGLNVGRSEVLGVVEQSQRLVIFAEQVVGNRPVKIPWPPR